ncbi:hypothetical protein [Raineyella sp. W15-4]|uniref:hypothetical protein n=1 Tax=Raineyella sp. W15-4 TaxID=3081651 RepID=UPI00295317B0|nr:hypothetical protein [Raineyella sp. W15-4]WOQ17606.1 hypothetical protein R0145_02520 [Raineyella sp. W15-4]
MLDLDTAAVVEVESQAMEEAAVELGPYIGGCLPVEVLWMLSQCDPGLGEFQSFGEVIFGSSDPAFDTAAFELDVVQQPLHLVLGGQAVHKGVEQPIGLLV